MNGGYSGITRPSAFVEVLKQYGNGATVERKALNAAMLDIYGGRKDNATWWTGVYMQFLVSVGLTEQVKQGTFRIKSVTNPKPIV